MKGASKVIMGATLVMILSLAIVLALVLVLLAELYCSLRRRRQFTLTKSSTPPPTTTTTTTTSIAASTRVPPSLTSYSHGVLFPSLATASAAADVERPHGKLHHFLSLQTLLDSAVNSPVHSPPTPVFVLSPPSSSRYPLISTRSPPPQKPAALPPLLDMQCDQLRTAKEHLVYISNPIFDNDSGAAQAPPSVEDDTPYETPDTSPSRLQKEGGRHMTPPLTPIKDLPTKACSITLSDARSLGPSGSESNSQNAAFSPTYSGSPSTSPSW